MFELTRFLNKKMNDYLFGQQKSVRDNEGSY